VPISDPEVCKIPSQACLEIASVVLSVVHSFAFSLHLPFLLKLLQLLADAAVAKVDEYSSSSANPSLFFVEVSFLVPLLPPLPPRSRSH
jgi:hypothetical protein